MYHQISLKNIDICHSITCAHEFLNFQCIVYRRIGLATSFVIVGCGSSLRLLGNGGEMLAEDLRGSRYRDRGYGRFLETTLVTEPTGRRRTCVCSFSGRYPTIRSGVELWLNRSRGLNRF